ncbi:MAG: hypothetical protein GXO86_01725 [Chlorobi bacterium]|nr:hypothetical protein [Chlorobiota bacterium]
MAFEPVVRNVKKVSLPFFYRLSSIVILIESTLGFLLFFTVFWYSVFNRAFVYNWGYDEFSGKNFYLLVILQLVLYAGLALSGIQLLRRKKSGFYIFSLSFLLQLATNYFVQNEFSFTGLIIGFMLWLILLLNYKILD